MGGWAPAAAAPAAAGSPTAEPPVAALPAATGATAAAGAAGIAGVAGVAQKPRYHALRALRHRGYRAYFFAQILSCAGTWMQSVAQGWLVFRLTGSSLLLGTVTFAAQVPVLLLAPFAGVLADRVELRKMVAVTQSLLALLALTIAGLTFADAVSVNVILVLAVLGGIVNAFDMPARQTLLVELAGPEDLSSAIALTSTAVNGARLVGPALAGLAVAAFGEAVCFLINGLSYVAPVAVALLVRPPHVRKPSPRMPVFASLRDGVAYARQASQTRTVLPVMALTSLVAFAYLPMLPALAGNVLHGGPQLLGWLNTSVGIGSVAGALAVASLVDGKRLLPRLAVGLFCFGGGLVALGLSQSAALSLLVLPAVGFGMLSLLSSANTIVQADTPEAMRGRVMALYTTVLTGVFPFGALLCGAIAESIGVGPTVAIGGGITLLCGVLVWRRIPALRAQRVGEGVHRAS